VELTFARSFLLKNELINDDFPTFDRPQRITSGKRCLGISLKLKADFTNCCFSNIDNISNAI
jgi:hypothetical protein